MQTQMEQTGVANLFDPEKNKIRNRSMVRVRVKNRNTRNLTLPGGNVVDPGVREVVCYDDEAAAILAMAEPRPDNIKVARERYGLAIAKQVAERLDPPFPGTMEELAQTIESGRCNEDQAKALKYVLDTTPSSVEGAFQDLTGRAVYPLESAEIIERGLAEPQRIAMKIEQDKQAAAQADALRVVLREAIAELRAPAPAQAEIDARINALVEAKVAAMLGDKTPAKK